MTEDAPVATSRRDRAGLTIATAIVGFVVGAVMVLVQRLTIFTILAHVARAPLPVLIMGQVMIGTWTGQRLRAESGAVLSASPRP